MRSCPYNIRMTECRLIQSEGTFMAIAENKSERIEIRTTPT